MTACQPQLPVERERHEHASETINNHPAAVPPEANEPVAMIQDSGKTANDGRRIRMLVDRYVSDLVWEWRLGSRRELASVSPELPNHVCLSACLESVGSSREWIMLPGLNHLFEIDGLFSKSPSRSLEMQRFVDLSAS